MLPFLIPHCPGSNYDKANFCNRRTQRLFYTTSHHFLGTGEEIPSVMIPIMKCSRRRKWVFPTVRRITVINHMWIVHLFWVHSVISIVVTLCCLISLLVPVNCTYFNSSTLPFVPPIFLSIPLQGHVGTGEWWNCSWFGVIQWWQ